MLHGSYSSVLVLFSVLVAILASYTALDMAGRISVAQGPSVRWWLAGGSLAMGSGIWSMHFIGMLAFRLPIRVSYDPAITSLSLLIAVASSAFALWLVCRQELPTDRLAMGALLMGAGVAGMHYTGMAAMRMHPGIRYSVSLVVLSLVIAVGASGAALWIAFRLRDHSTYVHRLRAGAAVVMGFAIAGMHYTAMAAAHFPGGSICSGTAPGTGLGIDNRWLGLFITVAALAELSITLVVSTLDNTRLASRTAILAASLAEANQELTYMTLHDNLTQLPNRVLLEDRLSQAMKTSSRDNNPFSVLFLDLDGFKAVNDAFGHHIGDLLLIEASIRIRACVRARDTLARLGGDEFVLLLEEAGEPTTLATIADKLVGAIGQPFTIEGHELRVSVSIGIAIHHDSDGQNDMLMNADAAMYHAKALGRNGYCFFESSMNAHAFEQVQMLHDLRTAIEQHQLVLHYQPKFEARDRTLVGAEALLRWQHPTRGLVPPNEFIPLAERTGLIVPIGEWVLDTACRQLRHWHDTGHSESHWTVAVNLSAIQFGHPGLARMVRETLERHNLEPRCLTLEITESTAMRDVESSMVILQQIYGMGVNISIDDFGTGYSSLLYLKRLPATEIKIDRGFVRDLAHDSEDAAIVSAIVALGRTLNLKVVAEGVETTAQQEFLTHLGCDSLQGFLLGRPMPADDFIEALSRNEISPVCEKPSAAHSWKLVAQTGL